jgi:hypothetical protein
MMAKALKAAADELLASVMEARFHGIAMAAVYKGGIGNSLKMLKNGINISVNRSFFAIF